MDNCEESKCEDGHRDSRKGVEKGKQRTKNKRLVGKVTLCREGQPCFGFCACEIGVSRLPSDIPTLESSREEQPRMKYPRNNP